MQKRVRWKSSKGKSFVVHNMRMVSLRRLISSFSAALRGIGMVVHEENSFRVQLIAFLGVLVLIAVVDLATWEVVALLMMGVLVLVLELVNTVFERLIDMMKPRLSPYVGAIKDMLAGAVLIASIGALIIGGVILWPHLSLW